MWTERQTEIDVVKFNDLPLAIQLSIDSLNASRRKKRLYALTGRLQKCDDTREKMWAQYNHLTNLIKMNLAFGYTHVGVFKTGDLILVSDKKREGQAYENGFILRVPI